MITRRLWSFSLSIMLVVESLLVWPTMGVAVVSEPHDFQYQSGVSANGNSLDYYRALGLRPGDADKVVNDSLRRNPKALLQSGFSQSAEFQKMLAEPIESSRFQQLYRDAGSSLYLLEKASGLNLSGQGGEVEKAYNSLLKQQTGVGHAGKNARERMAVSEESLRLSLRAHFQVIAKYQGDFGKQALDLRNQAALALRDPHARLEYKAPQGRLVVSTPRLMSLKTWKANKNGKVRLQYFSESGQKQDLYLRAPHVPSDEKPSELLKKVGGGAMSFGAVSAGFMALLSAWSAYQMTTAYDRDPLHFEKNIKLFAEPTYHLAFASFLAGKSGADHLQAKMLNDNVRMVYQLASHSGEKLKAYSPQAYNQILQSSMRGINFWSFGAGAISAYTVYQMGTYLNACVDLTREYARINQLAQPTEHVSAFQSKVVDRPMSPYERERLGQVCDQGFQEFVVEGVWATVVPLVAVGLINALPALLEKAGDVRQRVSGQMPTARPSVDVTSLLEKSRFVWNGRALLITSGYLAAFLVVSEVVRMGIDHVRYSKNYSEDWRDSQQAIREQIMSLRRKQWEPDTNCTDCDPMQIYAESIPQSLKGAKTWIGYRIQPLDAMLKSWQEKTYGAVNKMMAADLLYWSLADQVFSRRKKAVSEPLVVGKDSFGHFSAKTLLANKDANEPLFRSHPLFAVKTGLDGLEQDSFSEITLNDNGLVNYSADPGQSEDIDLNEKQLRFLQKLGLWVYATLLPGKLDKETVRGLQLLKVRGLVPRAPGEDEKITWTKADIQFARRFANLVSRADLEKSLQAVSELRRELEAKSCQQGSFCSAHAINAKVLSTKVYFHPEGPFLGAGSENPHMFGVEEADGQLIVAPKSLGPGQKFLASFSNVFQKFGVDMRWHPDEVNGMPMENMTHYILTQSICGPSVNENAGFKWSWWLSDGYEVPRLPLRSGDELCRDLKGYVDASEFSEVGLSDKIPPTAAYNLYHNISNREGTRQYDGIVEALFYEIDEKEMQGGFESWWKKSVYDEFEKYIAQRNDEYQKGYAQVVEELFNDEGFNRIAELPDGVLPFIHQAVDFYFDDVLKPVFVDTAPHKWGKPADLDWLESRKQRWHAWIDRLPLGHRLDEKEAANLDSEITDLATELVTMFSFEDTSADAAAPPEALSTLGFSLKDPSQVIRQQAAEAALDSLVDLSNYLTSIATQGDLFSHQDKYRQFLFPEEPVSQ